MKFSTLLFVLLSVVVIVSVKLCEARRLWKTKPRAHGQHGHRAQVARIKENFVSHSVLPDGEVVTRVSRRNVLLMETVARGDDHHAIMLREMTNGKVLVQSVYNLDGQMSDCDFSKDQADIQAFLQKFSGDETAGLRSTPITTTYASGVYYKRHQSKKGVNMTRYDDTHDGHFKDMTNIREQRRHCRQLHELIQKHRTGKGKSMQPEEKHRVKRAMLIYPGTNWCGAGSVAQGYNDLGLNINTDKCCREHDHCPYTIPSFGSNYNIFNYRFHTISHCGCDQRWVP